MAVRQWTLEQRQQQAKKIRQWQPWKHSTGARTAHGKSISSRNAIKHGMGKLLKEMRVLLRRQKDILKKI